MGVNTNSFENYKNSVEPSEKGGFLSKLQGFGIDSLGGIDSFMGKDIINANKLLKSFKGFNLSSILGNLGDFFKNLGKSALNILKDMGSDALRSLENASINFVSNLAEDLYNNVRSMMYIPDSAFAITLKSLYYAGADLAYNKHYIRKSALKRDWTTSLKFIDEQYGIDYNLRDYKDLENDLTTCTSNSCVNNTYYIFTKIHDLIRTLKSENASTAAFLREYTEPIMDYKAISHVEALTCTKLFIKSGEEMIPVDMGQGSSQGVEFVQDHPEYDYYTEAVIGYVGVENGQGLYPGYKYETNETKELVQDRYKTYKANVDLIKYAERLMVSYLKNLIVYSYTYLNATSVQKFFSDFSDVLSPKYYGITDDKYNKSFSFKQNDCLIMMPDYKGNDITKTDKYTQYLATKQNNEYLLSSGARSDASAAALEALEAKNKGKSASGVGSGPWSREAGYTVNSAAEAGTKSASAKIKSFRASALEKVTSNKNATYSSNIKNGLNGTLTNESKGLWKRSGQGINAIQDGRRVSSMYDRDIVKYYELVGSISDLVNKDTKYIVLRNKNIKQIYALLSNGTIYGDNRMVNDYFYNRCKLKTMNTLNQSLSKVGSILGSTYAVQALFDLESAVDSSAYTYIKKVEDYLLNPKEHSYYGMDTMFTPGNNMWTQFGDYFKQAYAWDDSVGNDPELEEMVEKLANTTPVTNSSGGNSSTSDIDPDKDLSSENGANSSTYKEILQSLKENSTASKYVDNVLRFVSTISPLDLRDMINKYLTMFYKFIKARDYNTEPYFSTLIKSMSGISNITHYNDLNTKVFSKSTQKSLLANIKFLISIYALKIPYKYFLTNSNDTNKEDITKIYNLVFAMGSAEVQMGGTIAALSKYDREQLNSLVKQNFFTSIKHLKSINDKNNPLIVGAPKYKDSLTITFGNSFDLRGITGYSFDNNRLLYVPEQSIGDWNSVGVGGSEESGVFFCKSSINNGESGIYRRSHNGGAISKLNVFSSSGTKITNRDFFVITFEDSETVYFGVSDFKKKSITESLFVYDPTLNKIVGVSGFNEDPLDYDFKVDIIHNIFIATSKYGKGCYYSLIGSNTITKGVITGKNHNFLTLGDNSVVVYPGNDSCSPLMYFSSNGIYSNNCNLPDISKVNSILPVVSEAILNTTQTITKEDGTTTTETTSTDINLYGVLLGTDKGILHCVAVSLFDPVTGQSYSGKQLEAGKLYQMEGGSPHFLFEDRTVISNKGNSEIVYGTIESSTRPVISGSVNASSLNIFKFRNKVSAVNNAYRPSDGVTLQPASTIKSCYKTPDGAYYLINRNGVSSNELYFLPKKYTSANPIMNLIHEEINQSITKFDVVTTKTVTGYEKTPNVVIYSNNSLDFVSIKLGNNIEAELLESRFEDIDTSDASEDSITIKQSGTGWKDLSVNYDNDIYLQNNKYGLILFNNGESVHDLIKYSTIIASNSNVSKSDLVFDYNILKANNTTFITNKSSGNKYIKNIYGIFKSANDGITRNYIDVNAFHDGDISSMAYDKYHNCIYFTTYRDKTIFDYDFLATIAAFDIDGFISKQSYYQLTKLAKTLLESQTNSTGDSVLNLLSSKKEDSTFTYTLDEILNKIIDASANIQESSQKSLLGSTLFADIANYKAATDIFDDVGNDEFNEDMTKEFILSYPGSLNIDTPDESNFGIPLSLEEIGDLNGDGVVNELDRNWYLALLNGKDINDHTSLDDWFKNLTNGVYGYGLGNMISLRLSYNEQIKLLANFRTSKAKYLTSGKTLTKDEIDSSVEGPNAIIDPSTDEESEDYKWYNKNKVDFASFDFENSDEDGNSEW